MSKQKEQVEQLKYNAEFEAKLKKQHGSVTKMTFSVEGQNLTAYLRSPELYELDATMSALTQAPVSAAVGLFKSCFIDGDKEILEKVDRNSGLGLAISKEIQNVVGNVLSSSTKL